MRKLLLLITAIFLATLSANAAEKVTFNVQVDLCDGKTQMSKAVEFNSVTVEPIFTDGTSSFEWTSKTGMVVPAGNGIKFSVPAGKKITEVNFGNYSSNNTTGVICDPIGTWSDNKQWTGESQSVTFNVSNPGNLYVRTLYVMVQDDNAAPSPVITIDPAGPLALGTSPVVRKVNVKGENLTDDITITCPNGVTAVPTTISKEDAMSEAGCDVTFTISASATNLMALYEVVFSSEKAQPVTLKFSGKITVLPTCSTLAEFKNVAAGTETRYVGENALVTFVDSKSNSIFIQEGDIAWRLYDSSSDFDINTVKAGDKISNFICEVSSTANLQAMYLYNGTVEVVSHDNAVEPKVIKLGTEEDFTNTRNMLVKIEGAKVDGTNYSISTSSSHYLTLTNSDGTTEEVLGAFAGTDVEDTNAPEGKFNLTGIRLYTHGVLPRSIEDIVGVVTPIITVDQEGTIDLGNVEAPASKTINVKGTDLAADINIIFPEYVTADKSVITKEEAMSEAGCDVTFTFNPATSGASTYEVVLNSEGADPVSIVFSGNFMKPGTLEMPIEVNSLTEITDNALYYHFSGEAVVTYVDKSSGCIYIQAINNARQANAGYMISVGNTQINLMNIGDRITNMILKPGYDGVARNQFNLQANAEATDGMLDITGNEPVEPKEVTLSDSWGRYEFVTIKNVTFINPDNKTFGNGSFGLKQGEEERENVVDVFSNSDMSGVAVPKGECDVTGIATIPNMIYPRSQEDIYVYNAPVINVTLTPETAKINLNKTLQLNVETVTENTDVEKIEWSSYYPEIASVDDDGLVTAHKLGDTIITVFVTSTDGAEFSAHANISVVGVTGITVTPQNEIIRRGGEKLQLTATVTPDDEAVSKEVTWSSSNEAVATVDQNGLVTPVAKGTVTISATSTDGTNVSGSTSINVIEVESVTVTPSEETINVGATVNLAATVEPTGAIQAVTWSSSNEAVATVDQNGVVTGVGEGTVTISATSTDGTNITGSATITVAEKGKIIVTPAVGTVKIGNTLQLKATEELSDELPDVTWTSSDESKATVDETTGVVTGVSVGSVTITATSNTTGKSGSAEITVEEAEFLYGDSNNDGIVNIDDVVADVQYILGQDPQPFDKEKADVNEDGFVNVVDISLTVDIFLNDTTTPAGKMMANAVMQNVNGINVEDVDLLNSNTMTVALGSIPGITAMQADIEMPEGVSIKNIKLADGIDKHILSFARHNNNRVRIAIYSLSLAEVEENSPMLEIELESEGTFVEKYAHISNIYASNVETGMMNFESVSVKLSKTAGINAIYADLEGSDIYTTTGILLKRNATADDMKALAPGLYIIGGKKVMIK